MSRVESEDANYDCTCPAQIPSTLYSLHILIPVFIKQLGTYADAVQGLKGYESYIPAPIGNERLTEIDLLEFGNRTQPCRRYVLLQPIVLLHAVLSAIGMILSSVRLSATKCIVTKRYILQQKCLKKWVRSASLEQEGYNFQPPTPTYPLKFPPLDLVPSVKYIENILWASEPPRFPHLIYNKLPYFNDWFLITVADFSFKELGLIVAGPAAIRPNSLKLKSTTAGKKGSELHQCTK